MCIRDRLWIPGRPPPSDGAIDELVDRLVSEREQLSAALAARLPVVQAAAERNFEVLGELLDDE